MAAFQNAGPGRSLRTNNPTTNNTTTTNNAGDATELRARRLAALEQRTTVPTSTTSTLSSSGTGLAPLPQSQRPFLPVSQQRQQQHHQEEEEQKQPDIQEFLPSFHSLMWDSSTTTPSDQERWFHQGIHTPLLWSDTHTHPTNNNSSSSSSSSTTHATTFEESHPIWGLVQSHGGPCGILAVVQAELIGCLRQHLLGNNHHNHNHNNHKDETKPEIVIPDRTHVQRALAEAMGIILARAAVSPRVEEEKETGECRCRSDEDGGVVLVLPAEDTEKGMLSWEVMRGGNHGGLRCVVVSAEDDFHTDENDHDNDDDDDETVRRKGGMEKGEEKAEENRYNSVAMNERRRRLARATARYLLSTTTTNNNNNNNDGKGEEKRLRLESFYGPGGVLLFTMGLVASRGVDRIRSDMDNPNHSYLTAQFGMTSQEMINLLITGQAVSNVFDNTITLGGATITADTNTNTNNVHNIKCHGIQSKPTIGYLSQLESLRYCEVGSYYKSPTRPIWVVGSTSHFTVLFGNDECLKESKSDELLERCRRAFKSVEGGEENGFVEVGALGTVLERLGLTKLGTEKGGGGNGVAALAASLEVSGAGIILWDDFWKAASRLLTGASLESVLQREGPMEQSQQQQRQPPTNEINVLDNNNRRLDVPSDVAVSLLTQFGEGSMAGRSNTAAAVQSSKQMETDEELARRLAAEWGTGTKDAWETERKSHGDGGVGVVGAALNAVGGKSDEELARELQAEWNAVDSGEIEDTNVTTNSAVAARDDRMHEMNPNGGEVVEKNFVLPNMIDEDGGADGNGVPSGTNTDRCKTITSDSTSEARRRQPNETASSTYDFETLGESFRLHHYNGLRGGTLTSFRVTRLTSHEAVGASVALSTQAQGASSAVAGKTGVGSGDLEDVVRTKYPSCTFDWGGRAPPFID